MERIDGFENKIKPMTSFTIFSPHKFSISCTEKQFKEFKEICDRKNIKEESQANIFRKWFFQLFNSKNMMELLQESFNGNKNPLYRREIAKAHFMERISIKDETGLTTKEFASYFREKMEDFIKSNGKKK